MKKKAKDKEKQMIEFCETCGNEKKKCIKKCTSPDVKTGASELWKGKNM